MTSENTAKFWKPTNPNFDPGEPMQVGGQAVIEGVMMRAKGTIATAVRTPAGKIIVKKERFHSIIERFPRLKVPIVRGAIGLIEMLYVGMKTLYYSADIAMGEPTNGKKPKKETTQLSLMITLVFSLALGIGIFFLLPLFLATQFFDVEQQPLLFNVIAGTVRFLILLIYLWAISLMPDIKRLFSYHGAEHKAVFAFEQNAPLTVESAMTFTRFHPRCGTSFILLVVLVSILLFSVLDAVVLLFVSTLTLPIRILTHIPFIVIVGGVSYEMLKLTAKHSASMMGRALVAPGLWMQRITTQEPDEMMLEVSLAALRAALNREEELVAPVMADVQQPVGAV